MGGRGFGIAGGELALKLRHKRMPTSILPNRWIKPLL